MALSTQRENFLITLSEFKESKSGDYKAKLTALFPNAPNFFESENEKTSFLKSFLRNLRIFIEKQMAKATVEGSTFYDIDTHELLRFIFWAAKRSYIDASNAFIIMEDVYDCLSMEEISTFFAFLEELITMFETFLPAQYQTMLRIGNSILKKFSKVHDNDFRGRVQLFLAKITSLSEKTAVNLKSNINAANVTHYSSTNGDEDNIISKQFKNKDFKELSNLRISFSSYRKFWELQKFLQNPTLLFSDEASVITEHDNLGESEPDVMEIESMEENALKNAAKENKVGAFCRFVSDIIEIFRKDPIAGSQDIFRQKNYPKYLTKYSLLNLQLKDPNFRKIWLTQVVSCLWSLRNPLKITQKKGFEIKEEDLEKIRNLEKKVNEHIREIPNTNQGANLDSQLNFFLDRERNWCTWKDNGCPQFDKPIPANFENFFKKANDQLSLASKLLDMKSEESKAELYPNYKEKESTYKFVSDNAERFLKDTNFDKDNSLFNYLHRPVLPQKFDSLEPSVSYYFNSFLSEMKDPDLAEEDKLASDAISVWRGLRVLARNCLNQFTISKSEVVELKLEDILKRISKNDAGGASEKVEGEAQEGKEAKDQKPVVEEKKKSEKEGTNIEVKEEKSETKSEKDLTRKDSKDYRDSREQKDNKDQKEGEQPKEKTPERQKELKLEKSESRPDKEKITERIKSKVSENERNERGGDKPAERNIQIPGRKRSPEGDIKEYEKQPSNSKKPKT